MPALQAILLVDNGSLQPASTLRLRQLAAALSARVGLHVEPVSLLHSSAITPDALGGEPAEILEPAIRRRFATGVREFVVVPLFIGPSGALTEYIPARVRSLVETMPGLVVRLAEPLVDPTMSREERVASILADHVRRTINENDLERPWVVVVDHGSPQAAVAAVRDHLANLLASQLGDEVQSVHAASMERRDGPEYAFSDPLLSRVLQRVDGPGVLTLLFFSPGRHAGPGGDIEAICAEAMRERPGLRVYATPLIGEHPGVIEILADRLRAVLPE